VTKRFDSIVRRMAPVFGSIWWIFRSLYSPTHSVPSARERQGVSAFVLEGGVVYHTYSSYARGVDGLWSMYQWLDRAPKGRNEKGFWWRRHDEYDQR